MWRIVPLAVLCLAFAPAPLPRKDRGSAEVAALKLLQGEWIQVKSKIGTADVRGNNDTMSIAGRTVTYLTGGQATAIWNCRIDTTRVPTQLAYYEKGQLLLVIYRLDGDTLTMSWQNDGNARGRPVDFEGGPGIGVSVYQRKKP